ncbi:MAG: ATP-binding protein [Verrucomicrobiota bacterium]
MKTLLLISKAPGFSEAIRALLDPKVYRLVSVQVVAEAEQLLCSRVFDACIFDADLTEVEPIRTVQDLLQLHPGCRILIYASATSWEWEEEAYLLGVRQILSKPIRGRLLVALLDRFWQEDNAAAVTLALPARNENKPVEALRNPVKTLEVLRDFSGILTHSLFPEALPKEFLLLLREIIGVHRAAIFLRKPAGLVSKPHISWEDRRLRAACAIGLSHDLLDHFELSLDGGIGGFAFRQNRILRSDSEEVARSREMQKEFELLGACIAVPILDRETLLGVAVFDQRVTEEPFTNEELALIFHLLEELALALKNSWLHDQLAANHQMMGEVLNQIGCGCIVIDRNLEILHANSAAAKYFQPRHGTPAPLTFSHLPQPIGSKVFEVLRSGTAIPSFKYEPDDERGALFRITITPFNRSGSRHPNAALLVVEDATQAEHTQRLEIETSNLRLVKSMAQHLAHEIGNSLVPIVTYSQLETDRNNDPELKQSLSQAMAKGLTRIARLSNQMVFLAHDDMGPAESIPVGMLIEDSFAEAKKYYSERGASLKVSGDHRSLLLSGNRAGLKHALAELILNGLQANPRAPEVEVQTFLERDEAQRSWLRIEVRDHGNGFSAEALHRARDPFFTTRNVGLGLGLTVARKIIEAHQGTVEVAPSVPGQGGRIVLSLPLELLPESATEPQTQP